MFTITEMIALVFLLRYLLVGKSIHSAILFLNSAEE